MLEEKRETLESKWTLAYDSFDPEEEGLREALTSTGNGYFCTRGALAWADGVSYPGTYTHGLYNRETTIMAGDRKSTRLNSSHANISYAVFCLKKKKKTIP